MSWVRTSSVFGLGVRGEAVVVVLGLCGCDPRIPCDWRDRCPYEATPFCDIDGLHPDSKGHPRTCIPHPDRDPLPPIPNSGRDGGSLDAGGTDSGSNILDAGPPEVDAGPPKVDAGPPAVDAGPPAFDAGPPAMDAGPPAMDAGPPEMDAGPPIVTTPMDAGRPLPSAALQMDLSDYDGDRVADVAVRRGTLTLVLPTSKVCPEGFVPHGPGCYVEHGGDGDVAIAGDFDGDGKTNVGVWRLGTFDWHIHGGTDHQFGLSGDIPVPADYNGDRITDIAVFRPSNATWYFLGGTPVVFGVVDKGDLPAPGDYDGDGHIDLAVYRSHEGTWHWRPSSTGVGEVVHKCGLHGDIPVPGDYTGDGKTDPAVFRPSDLRWYRCDPSGTGTPIFNLPWGDAGETPAPADYDGDGVTDIAVFRPLVPLADWSIRGPDGHGVTRSWGLPGDHAVLRVPYPSLNPAIPR